MVSVHPQVLQAQRATFEAPGCQCAQSRLPQVHTALTYLDPRHTLSFRTHKWTLRRPPALTPTDAPSPAVL